MIDSISDRIASSLTAIRAKNNFKPEIAIILGSGLGPLADEIDLEASIPFADLPGFPVSTAPGHVGRVVLGTLEGRRVIAFQGRVHLYEGYSAQEVVLPVRLSHALGARVLVVSNACGGLNPAWSAGDIMLQSDYINFTGANPLIGPNDPNIGVRFVPMMLTIRSTSRLPARRLEPSISNCVKAYTWGFLAQPTRPKPNCACSETSEPTRLA
jgi:purine-nucleoside phosphorylase